MTNRGITVTQLNNYIKQVFEAEELLHNIEVIGDISSFKPSGNAVYFTLKDETASIPAVSFIPGIFKDIKDGEKVIVRGTVSYWHKAGKTSFIINKCEKLGLSPLYLLFLQLQEKLKSEGLFDTATKKSIPSEVKRIGVVTSKTGAVIHDIKIVAWRRNPAIDIVIIDTHVQGAGADIEISDAIRTFNQLPHPPDVIIVARGGGSAEDLSAFNSELVARAVFASKIPVVSAVGHESDFTLIDFVSDLRAPTPSAAAELCVKEIITSRDKAIAIWQTLKAMIAHKIDRAWSMDVWKDLKSIATARLGEIENRVAVLATQIEGNNPLAILKKGFTKANTDLNKIKTGDEFEISYYNNVKDNIQKGVAEWKRKLT